jgi:hypothetical protein
MLKKCFFSFSRTHNSKTKSQKNIKFCIFTILNIGTSIQKIKKSEVKVQNVKKFVDSIWNDPGDMLSTDHGSITNKNKPTTKNDKIA